MSFDGSFTHAMTGELNQLVSGGRVSKINQPYDNEIVLTVRSNHENYPILISANPNYARVQVSKIPYVNPHTPTTFTMTLRKHLSGSVLKKVSQIDNDRVMIFHFTTRNEIGDLKEMRLVVEIMARHSNIILVDTQDDMRIIDAIKRIGADKNRYRTILPGDTYITPPNQDMVNPFDENVDYQQIEDLTKEFPNQEVLSAELRKRIQGLGKDTSLYLAQAMHEDGTVKDKFDKFFDHFNNPIPTMIEHGKSNSFNVYPFEDNNIQYDTLSELLDNYYETKARLDRVREQGGQLIKVARSELKKNKNKKKKLEKTLNNTKYADEYRIKGEILTTYLYKIQKGMTKIALPNFYDNGNEIDISISNQLTPSENAQKYFKRYQKEKNAVSFVTEQLKKTNDEIDYFENILSQIEIANPSDLDDIKVELKNEGYLKHHNNRNTKNKNKNTKISKPEEFITDKGIHILVGKNNLQNDKLTMKDADKRDTWLHTQKIHGSHVIIKDFNPDDDTIETAAMLAAYFSKARDSATVPVDYVQVKKIRKPNGSKPGFVIYEGQKTIFVTPSKEFVDQLRENK
ncbi:NFACT family protein [Apilactobacillus kunkeei]|uniref:NFACT RNA binding domain-containing protein n=1 Tax=Apilactobacillus kunkeei TaxID=148814 RepID=UPI001C6FB303|nr:NFACT RNA binding domain-containing protein [Apilactobacillus kunkeei]MBX8455530.1 NFACT family protein [Apilactobacillus kunkeei]MCX0325682.1 NFACT family protein [Apilactobacillus kunkeei]QYU55041.1 NFACT family protein [Apilactobacillus kunkeei]CAI2594884.1 Rqc2 RqcH [Apilactobacillus kunkeei]CAI2595101.1 Rqc2 RqcH [Apilactobacillus kunkeei]